MISHLLKNIHPFFNLQTPRNLQIVLFDQSSSLRHVLLPHHITSDRSVAARNGRLFFTARLLITTRRTRSEPGRKGKHMVASWDSHGISRGFHGDSPRDRVRKNGGFLGQQKSNRGEIMGRSSVLRDQFLTIATVTFKLPIEDDKMQLKCGVIWQRYMLRYAAFFQGKHGCHRWNLHRKRSKWGHRAHLSGRSSVI